MTGFLVLGVALAVTLLVVLVRRRTDGRFRTLAPAPVAPPSTDDTGTDHTGTDRPGAPTSAQPVPADAERVDADEVGAPLGDRLTLLQFSSAFCTPCRATRTLLADVVADRPDVAHVEVDAESHLDLVRRLGILRTPTVLVVGADGRVLSRASGVPRRDQVLAVLDA